MRQPRQQPIFLAVMEAARGKKLTPADRLVLAYLAVRQGGNGEAWPGIKTIGRDLGLSHQTVANAIDRLVRADLIAKTAGHRGRNCGHRYSVRCLQKVLRNRTIEDPESPTHQDYSQAEKSYGVGLSSDNSSAPKSPIPYTEKSYGVGQNISEDNQINARSRPTTRTSPTHRKQRRRTSSLKALEDDALFARFWSVYPKRVGKLAARKVWTRLRTDAALTDRIIAGVEQYAQTEQWQRDGGRYIPHASTFLNQRRWEDEIEPSTVGAALGCAPCDEDEAKQLLRDAGLWEGE